MLIHKFLYFFFICLYFSAAQYIECPFASLNSSFFPVGKPPYLQKPALQKYSTTCNAMSGIMSCCDENTLKAIKDNYETHISDIVGRASGSMRVLKDIFKPLLSIRLATIIGDAPAKKMDMIIEKELLNLKTRIHLMNIGMARCYRTINQAISGFLCSGCDPNTEVFQANSSTPEISVNPLTITDLQKNCENYIAEIQTIVDDVHRAKMMIIDYLTAEVGVASYNCTCGGNFRNRSGVLDFDFSNKRLLAEPTKLQPLKLDNYLEQSMKLLHSNHLTYINRDLRRIGNDSALNNEVDDLINSDFKKFLNKHTYYTEVFSDYQSFILALFQET